MGDTDAGDRFGRPARIFAGGPHDWVTAADADEFFGLIERILEAV
ncbi:MAG: hypothetical protein R3C04_07335 [Hyphomonas sp.]